ncbi:MAG: MFS transporter [Xanthomonadales bacterium]|jgi:ACS family glucarate transporter-like MFS transporter|nr:MFS transporter [Xanthomonadales bacterium]
MNSKRRSTRSLMPVRWRVFAVIALGSFVSYVLRANLSIAAPAMMEDLSLSEADWGLVLAAFTAGYALFQFPGGMLGDRFGPRKALTAIAVAWFIFTVLTALVPSSAPPALILALLVTVRFGVGAVHAPIFPVQNTVFAHWFPPGGRALPLGLSSTALTLGFAAAAPLLAGLIVLFGWRGSFLLIAPLGLLVASLWWWYGRDDPSEHRGVDAAELALIRGEGAGRPAGEGEADAPGPIPWKRVLLNRDVLFLMASYSCMNFVFYEVFNWFYLYLVEQRGFDPVTAGWVTSSQWIAGAAGAALGGWLCDRLCRRLGLRWGSRLPIVIGLLICGALLAAGAVADTPALAVALLALCFFFNQVTEGAYWASSISIGGRLAGSAGGVMNTGANVMGIANAMLVPWFAQAFGWTFAIASGALFALAGAVFMLLVRADRPLDLP